MDGIIGIIAAMQEEMQEIKNKMNSIKEVKHKNIIFYLGKIEEIECVLVQSGVGKVNASRTTTLLINKFNISKIINVGSAGAINKDINVGDVVIAKELWQYDFDITAFGHEKGYITDIGKSFYSDNLLLDKAYNVMNNMEGKRYSIFLGNIGSGDKFFTSMQEAEILLKEFNTDCVEMEAAAIAQICYLEEVPFISIKSISDTPNGNNNLEFDKYLQIASKRVADFLVEYIKV